MTDPLTPERRSAQMARIRRSDTKPELAVRRLLHRLGYRFNLQLASVPGRPDVAFTKRRIALFVHGCFWHGHEGCPHWRMPKSRTEFWSTKISNNRARDLRLQAGAEAIGWTCLVVWECETENSSALEEKLVSALGPPKLLSKHEIEAVSRS